MILKITYRYQWDLEDMRSAYRWLKGKIDELESLHYIKEWDFYLVNLPDLYEKISNSKQ